MDKINGGKKNGFWRKTAFLLLASMLVTASIASANSNNSEKPHGEIEIRLSKDEWRDVKNTVDTNGWCRIQSQNALIAVTNGIPKFIEPSSPNRVIHSMPIGRVGVREFSYPRIHPQDYVK